MGLLGKALAPIGNLAGSIINTVGAKRAQDRENKQQMKMAEYSYSKDLEMWNRQNEYNTPLSQMARFSEAGLNPNLIYGQGSAGNASQLPKYSAPTLREKTRLPNIQGVLPAYQDYELKQAQVDQTTANTRLIEEKSTTEAVNRAMASFHLDKNKWMWEGGFNKPGEAPLHYGGDKRLYPTNQQYKQDQLRTKSGTMIQQREMAKYNAQIAEQMLKMRIKDNQYYFWKNVGAGVSKGAMNMLRFGKGKMAVKGLKTPKLPTKLSPRGKYFRDTKDMLPNYNF